MSETEQELRMRKLRAEADLATRQLLRETNGICQDCHRILDHDIPRYSGEFKPNNVTRAYRFTESAEFCAEHGEAELRRRFYADLVAEDVAERRHRRMSRDGPAYWQIRSRQYR